MNSKESSLHSAFHDMAVRFEQLVMESSLLRELDELKAFTDDTDGLCHALVRIVASGLSAENCSIMLLDESEGVLELRAGASPLDGAGGVYAARKGFYTRLPLGDGIAGRVAQTRHPAIVDDVQADPAFLALTHPTVEFRSLLCMPLSAEGRVLGVLNASHPNPGFFTKEIQHALELTSERMARVLITHQLYKQMCASELQYRMVLENAANGILVFDLNGSIVTANPKAAFIAGISPEALVSGEASWESGIHPDDLQMYQRFQKQSLDSSDPLSCVYRYRDHAGTFRLIEQNNAPMKTIAGGSGRVVADIRDITEQRRAQEDLRQSEEKFRALTESTSAATFIFQDTAIKYVNPAAIAITGYSETELLAMPFWAFIHPDFQSLVRDRGMSRQQGAAIPKRYELKIITKDGRERWVDYTAGIFHYEGRMAILGIVFDITDRKEAEDALRQSEDRFRSLAEMAPALIFEMNTRGLITFVNQYGLHMTGYTWEDFVTGFNAVDLIAPRQRERARQNMGRILAGEDLGAQEYVAQCKNGDEISLLCCSARITRNSKVTGIRGIFLDISERKQREEQLYRDEARTKALLELNQRQDLSPEDVANYAIETAVLLTGSVFGYIAFVNKDESELTMLHWSQRAVEQCAVTERRYVYPVCETGLWGEAVRQRHAVVTNDYAADNLLKKGLPQGHVPLLRHMNIPVFDAGHIVAVAGVGNKAEDYTEEDVRQLSLLMDGMWRVVCQKRAEAALHRRDAILEAVSYVAERLLKTQSWETDIQEVLQRLGQATEVSRVYVFENRVDDQGRLRTNQRYEWVAEGITPQIDNPVMQNASMADLGFHRWVELQSRGEAIFGMVRDMPLSEQKFMSPQEILSVAVMPINVGNVWWGFLGFDDCRQFREWSTAEISALYAAAGTLGAAIERQRTDLLIANQQLKMVASSRLSSLGVMASGVAHEINNPLAVISIGAEQLDRLCKCPNPDVALIAETAAKMRRNVSRIEKIIRGLRILSRDGSDEPLQMKRGVEIVEETFELCRSRFEAHGIGFLVEDSAPDVLIECRPTLLSQVVMNLLNNAFDAVEALPEKWVKVTVGACEKGIELSVMDSGGGVPETIHDRIFEPFFTTKDIGKGTGLGLSISKAVIESHHGELFIDSGGSHTRFVVQLPVRQL